MYRKVVAGTATMLLAALCTAGCTSSPAPTTGPGGSPKPIVVTPGVPPPAGATGAPVAGITKLPPVAVGQAADLGSGLLASVQKIDPLQITGSGPGELNGPGIGVTVQVENKTSQSVDLGGIVVNASYGNGQSAAGSLAAPFRGFAGQLETGKSAQAVYVFQVPESDAASVVVDIDYSGAPNVVIVRR
jgi:hypothetical protein